jgi:hypothetical protein
MHDEDANRFTLTFDRIRPFVANDPVLAVMIEELIDLKDSVGVAGRVELATSHLVLCLAVLSHVAQNTEDPASPAILADTIHDLWVVSSVLSGSCELIASTEKTMLISAETLTKVSGDPLTVALTRKLTELHTRDPRLDEPFKSAYNTEGA